MAAISGIDPIAAPLTANAREQRAGERPSVDFGAAVTHRDAVREKLRVDPAALSDRKRAASALRHAEQDDDERPGQYIDIEV